MTSRPQEVCEYTIVGVFVLGLWHYFELISLFAGLTPGANVLKLFVSVIYGF